MIEAIKKEIPEVKTVKDNFGGDYFYIPKSILTKRKAWNLLLKRGFTLMPNKAYLKKDNIYAFNSTLKDHLVIEFANA